ncbi:MAG: AI-2E family transporter, partial [Gramella sp.]|nr:AI-2E family transporter [Christiangramia sp.]
MKAQEFANGILRATGIMIGILLLLYFLWEIQSVIVYVAVAGVIALIGRPIVIFLRNKLRLPNQLAVITVLVMVLAIFAGIIFVFVPIVIEQSKYLGQIDIEAFKSDLNDLNEQINNYLGVEEINIIEGLKRSEFVKNFDISLIPQFL